MDAFEGHLSYDLKPRIWASLDGNFWYGGTDEIKWASRTRSLCSELRSAARLGSHPKHQSSKFSYADGAYIRFGGNYQNVSVAWQYSWYGEAIGNGLCLEIQLRGCQVFHETIIVR